MNILIVWSILCAPQAAPPPTTLDGAMKSVPLEARQKIDGALSTAKERHKTAEYWVLGNALAEAIKPLPRWHWLPVFLTALRKEDAKTAAALLHVINSRFGELYTSEEDMEKDRALDALLAREVLAVAANPDRQVRLGAVTAIKGLVDGGVKVGPDRPGNLKKVEYVDKALREKMRSALETASKDADRDIRAAAEAGLRELRKEATPADAAKLAAKTIEQWMADVAPAVRNDLGSAIDKALGGARPGAGLGEDVYSAISTAALEDWTPLILTRLKTAQGKKAIALLFAIGRKSQVISFDGETMRNPAALRPLDGLTVKEAASKLGDPDLEVRREAHRALDDILLRTNALASSDPKMVGLDAPALAALLKAYEAASKDPDPALQKAAVQRAAALRGR